MREAETVVEVKPWEAQRDEAIAKVREDVRELLVLLIENHLKEEFKMQTRDLDLEDRGLENEWQILSESRSNLAPITEAKVRVLGRQVDDDLALGNIEEADRKRQEASAVQENFDAVLDRIEQVHLRRTAIVQEKRRIAYEIFEERFESLPSASFALLGCVVNLLDGFRTGMLEFQSLTRHGDDWHP